MFEAEVVGSSARRPNGLILGKIASRRGCQNIHHVSKSDLARCYYGARPSEEGNGAHLGLIRRVPVLEKFEVAVTYRTSHEHAISP